MTAALALAVAGLLALQLVVATRLQLGPAAWHLAPGALALGVAAGLLARLRLPYLGAGLGVALLGAARGPLLELLRELLGPGMASALTGCLLGLAPLGFLLGRQLAPLAAGGLLRPALGVALAAVAASWGVLGRLPPAWATAPLAAVLLACLAEAGRHRDAAREDPAPGAACWSALPLTAVATLIWLALARHVPAYVTPSGPAGPESLAALLLPALVVALPARVLAPRPGRMRRVGLTLALLLAGWAAWTLAHTLSLHAFQGLYAQRTWEWRGLAQRLDPWLDAWRVWLLVFGGWGAAALGLGLAAAGRRAAGPAALGVGAAWLAQEWAVLGSGFDAQRLLVLAGGVGALGALWPWHRRAWVLTPLALVALAVFPLDRRDDMLRLRRVGEMEATRARRDRLGEVLLFGTGRSDNLSADGREAWRRTFTGERLVFPYPLESPPPAADPDAEAASRPGAPVSAHGLRLAGLGAHEGAPPLGPEGSLGRLLRVFHRDGAALALGHTAELLAAELAALDPGRRLEVGSDLRLGDDLAELLLHLLGLPREVPGDHGDTLLQALEHRPAGGWELVVLAPERAHWPLAGRVLTRDVLARVAAGLAPRGRCLAWVDSTDLDARALGARLAAFGDVFGERAAAFVEPRGLGPPLLLLLGWGPDGAPAPDLVAPRLPTPQRTGRRPILDTPADLAALALLDGPALSAFPGRAPVHRAARPVAPGRGPTGWEALARWEGAGLRPGEAVAGLPPAASTPWPVARALAAFDPARFDVDRPGGSMIVEIAEDVDWAAFERLVDALADARASAPDQPLLPVVTAALLEPLAQHEEYGRFASAWERLGADALAGWRLPAALAHVAGAMRKDELAAQAAERARSWAASRRSGEAAGAAAPSREGG